METQCIQVPLPEHIQQQQYLFANSRTPEKASAHQSWFLTKTHKLNTNFGTLVVTIAMLLRLINCRFIIIIALGSIDPEG